MKKSTLVSALTIAMGGVSMSAQAALTSSATLQFDAGAPITTGCLVGGFVNGACTLGSAVDVTDMGGSYFRMDQGGVAADEKVAISQFAALHFGGTQLSSGQHTGTIDGSESPAVDNPWNFFGNTGMHTNTTAMTDLTGAGSVRSITMAGWGVNWSAFGPGGASGPTINMGGTATLVCSTASCSDTSTYTLDMDVHVPVAFPSVPYSLHLEGHINGGGSSSVPVPAAAWLFGSGLVGLAGVARRRRDKK